MLTIDTRPPVFCARAVGILEGQLVLNPAGGEKAFKLVTDDGAEVPGIVHGKAAKAIIENPLLLGVRVRLLAYPRTSSNILELIAVDIEAAGDEVSKQKDMFLIQGYNVGTRSPGKSQIGIRPNRNSKHQFKKFWLTLHGHLNEDIRCVYQLKALRKGRKLFILESSPIQPKKSPKSIDTPRKLSRVA